MPTRDPFDARRSSSGIRRPGVYCFAIVALWIVGGAGVQGEDQREVDGREIEGREVDFAREIYPLLRRACFECHGADQQKADLRLDSRASAFASDSMVVPGQPDESELMRRISLPHGDSEIMPATGEPLPANEIELIRAWIAQGARWPEKLEVAPHWAYVKPVRPTVPSIQDSRWSRNEIDAFVLSRLQRSGLQPSPEAARDELARRLYLDLSGLPPSPAELDAFLGDPSDDAYERLVDRLLAQPQFGARWARPWLDLARYADSHGFQRDDLRDLWPYRDWVIEALNADMPFDQFTIEQIGGDLIPGASESQKIATGFHRCTPINVEAGSIPEETRTNQVIDRVNTTATIWLGTTLACAQCHDHKYDPFSQREYFQLFAFFNNTEIEASRKDPKVPSSITFLGPSMPLSDSQANAERRRIQAELRRIRRSIAERKQTPPQGTQPDPCLDELTAQAERVEKELNSIAAETTLVMRELDEPRQTHLFERGDYRTPGEPVDPAVPAVLHPLAGSARNRLELARWLVSRDNPLVARVTVNRLWAELFGHGIVSTLEDFGIQGAPPTHPELLDWLAVEFMDNGWSRKQILKKMVMSATYRQSSYLTPERWTQDDRNRLYARGPRQRMDAEMIRDTALSVAGLLSRKQGGPPIRPFQPKGTWTKVGGEKYDYQVSPGQEAYRRGIYVVWKRGAPYPSFMNFDATARLTCTVSRSRTNTPLQALTLLNDPVYVEAAMALARRILIEQPSDSVRERIRNAFRLCTARYPDESELLTLETLYTQQIQASQRNPQATQQMIAESDLPKDTSGEELVAWYSIATTLLNLDETITK